MLAWGFGAEGAMKRREFRVLALVALLAAAFAAQAARPATFAGEAEASLLLKGTVDIRADGTVERYSLDDTVKLPTSIVELIAGVISGWRFEPVMADGKPAAARTVIADRRYAEGRREVRRSRRKRVVFRRRG